MPNGDLIQIASLPFIGCSHCEYRKDCDAAFTEEAEDCALYPEWHPAMPDEDAYREWRSTLIWPEE